MHRSPVCFQNVIRRLASDDDITVAGPVLAKSPRLTDQNLIEIAERKGQSHMSKIAERTQLSLVVTDVLVDRGDREVVTKVAGNTGAPPFENRHVDAGHARQR